MVALQDSFTRRPERRSLLIADQEAALRRALESLFRTEGYETYLAADDTEAFGIVHRERIDVVIIELELPHGGGLNVLRVIRQVSRPDVPCVLTAAEVSGRVQLAALNEDVFTVVPKPVDDQVMKDVVRSAMRRYSPY